MKKVKLKKWFAVLLALSLTVTLLSGTVYAEETEQQTEQGDSAEKKEDSECKSKEKKHCHHHSKCMHKEGASSGCSCKCKCKEHCASKSEKKETEPKKDM